MTPMDDIALCIELGRRAVEALMTQRDWENRLDRILESPNQPWCWWS